MSPHSLLATILLLASLAAPPSSSRTTTKVFTSPGTKIVTLKVCNAAGACSTTTKTLVVLNPKPFLTSHTPVPPLVGSASLPLSLDAVFQGRPPLQPSWKVSASPLRPARTLPMARWLWFPDSFGAYTLSFTVRNSSGSASSPSYSTVVVPSTFSDVGPALPFANAVETLHARRIADPCSSSPPLFCPDPSLTRGEAALWIDRAAFSTPPPPPAGLFSDVPPSHPAAAAIERLARSAIVLPCAPQRFCPGEPISRAQAAAFLLRARLGASWTPPPASGLFADVPVFDPLAAYVEHFYRLGYTSGCSTLPRLFCPSAPVDRGSMALFLASVFALEQTPTPLSFTVRACPHPCTLPTRLPLRFDLAYSAGIPSSFDYDWAGDGTFEESSPGPSASSRLYPARHLCSHRALAPWLVEPRLQAPLSHHHRRRQLLQGSASPFPAPRHLSRHDSPHARLSSRSAAGSLPHRHQVPGRRRLPRLPEPQRLSLLLLRHPPSRPQPPPRTAQADTHGTRPPLRRPLQPLRRRSREPLARPQPAACALTSRRSLPMLPHPPSQAIDRLVFPWIPEILRYNRSQPELLVPLALEIETTLALISRTTSVHDLIPKAILLNAVASSLHARNFQRFPSPLDAFLNHKTVMLHRVATNDHRAWPPPQPLRGALANFRKVFPALRMPAESIERLQHVRLHLADVSNYLAFILFRPDLREELPGD